jgi:Xaa-Pro aminopeptidase
MRSTGVDGLLLFKPPNIRYVASAKGVETPWDLSECCVAVIDQDPVVFLSPDIGLHAPWLAHRLRGAPNLSGAGARGDETVAAFTRELADITGNANDFVLGIDVANVPVWRHLERAGFRITDANPALEEARTLKTDDEVALLRTAAAVSDAGLFAAIQSIQPGKRETDVSAELIAALRRLGSDWYIRGVVSSGDHTHPQYKNAGGTDRIIQPGDLVLFDIAQACMGYWSDMGRTVVCGTAALPAQRDVYQRCQEMLFRALGAVKPGSTTADLDRELRKNSSRAEFSCSAAAHGIGTTLHEPPMMREGETTELQPKMVLALEVYVGRDRHGVRLEENLVVTDDGFDLITRSPYDPVLEAAMSRE